MRKGENYNTGCEPNQRPKNKRNAKKRVAHVAAVVAFLNKAVKDENKYFCFLKLRNREGLLRYH